MKVAQLNRKYRSGAAKRTRRKGKKKADEKC